MRTSVYWFIIGGVFTLVAYNNCSAVHQGDNSLDSFQACNLISKAEFEDGYHGFLQANCASCHYQGGTGNGYFADSNVDTAFDAFVVRGNLLVGERALDPSHQAPFTGPQHQNEINNLDQVWAAAQAQVDACIAASGASGGGSNIDAGIVPDDVRPTSGTIQTFVKEIQLNLGNGNNGYQRMTWDLEDEILTPSGLSFTGASLSVEVRAITTVNGDKSYSFRRPTLNAGNQSMYISYIDFVINNQVVTDATAYQTVNLRVPAGVNRELGVGGTTFLYDVQPNDVVALSIGVLEAINFDPPTFAELTSPTGVFGQHCISCHGATNPAAGLDLSNRDSIITQLAVSPYNPNNSEIFIRMNDAANPMPATGILPQAELDSVLQWIQNGARDGR